MKKLVFLISVIIILGSCGSSDNGQLIGVRTNSNFYHAAPYGMLYIPQGSFNMGVGDQDVPYEQTANPKTVSVSSFFMDETEITNNEYRQFVNWVRDSIARSILGQSMDAYLITETPEGELVEPPLINWQQEINWGGEEEKALLEELYLPEHERFFDRKEFDTRKLIYEYFWIDLQKAANKKNRYDYKTKTYGGGITDRSAFVKKRTIHVYPDTLCWIHDFTYSFNEPLTKMYFWHPAYDNYPVVGVNWLQARAFSIWRTQFLNNFLAQTGQSNYTDFRLPTESEWEWAARGGLDLNPYPWGGPYTRHQNGCFLANFKPMRGNYIDDGGMHTLVVAHYDPNNFGLYDMAGNVAEWSSNAYDESAYNFGHDMNMDYKYEANENDPVPLKRKVIRGGSWKDVAYYLQVNTRDYEYQDTAKSYVGFRCVQTYMGRELGDSDDASQIYDY